MKNNTTLKAVLWAANAVVWGCVYVVDKNLKSELKHRATRLSGTLTVDLSGPVPLRVVYLKKRLPEFTIYQV